MKKIKYVNNAVQLTVIELRNLVKELESRNIWGITLKANYCLERDCVGSQEWNALHLKNGKPNKRHCDLCKEVYFN